MSEVGDTAHEESLPIRAREAGFSDEATAEIVNAATAPLDIERNEDADDKDIEHAERRRRQVLVDRRVECIAFLMRRGEYEPGVHCYDLAQLWDCNERTVYGYSAQAKRLSRLLNRDDSRFKLVHALDIGLGAAVEVVREANLTLRGIPPQAKARTFAIDACSKALGALEKAAARVAALTGADEPTKTTHHVIADMKAKDFTEHPQFQAAQAVIYEALQPYPEALAAVVRALAGLGAESPRLGGGK